MMEQHLYLIVPSEYADKTNVWLPIQNDIDYMSVAFFGQFSTFYDSDGNKNRSLTGVAEIGKINGKSAMHLFFPDHPWCPVWSKLSDEIRGQTGLEDLWRLENIEIIEQALCLPDGVMICLDLDHLKARDPDFAMVTISQDEDGNDVESSVLRDMVFAV